MSAPPRALSLLAGQRQKTINTTDATPTVIWSRTLDDDTAYVVTARVVARDSTGTDHNGYERIATVYRTGGGATLGAFGSVAPYTDEQDLDWDVAIDTSSNDARVMVTGEAGRTVQWTAVVTLTPTTP